VPSRTRFPRLFKKGGEERRRKLTPRVQDSITLEGKEATNSLTYERRRKKGVHLRGKETFLSLSSEEKDPLNSLPEKKKEKKRIGPEEKMGALSPHLPF